MSIFEKIFGKEFYQKDELFKEKLQEIEEEFIEYFKKRKSKFDHDEHDRLHNHYLIYYENGIIRFGFDKDSDIPKYIMQKCIMAFNETYKDDSE